MRNMSVPQMIFIIVVVGLVLVYYRGAVALLTGGFGATGSLINALVGRDLSGRLPGYA